MDILVVFALLAFALNAFKSREQKERIALLGSYLGKFQIEKLMQDVLDGYQRALGESDPDRQAQVWRYLATQEQTLAEQFGRFVLDFAQVYEARTRVSRLPLALPFVSQAIPASTFDLRKLMSVHSQGLSRAVANSNRQDAKGRAFTLMAELLLMQHSCHWFCRSKIVASARMMARHKTAYVQLLAAVSPETRQAYAAVVSP
jgi:hypothetical protein